MQQKKQTVSDVPLQRLQHTQRYDTELKFESQPRSSRYSNQLMELMRTEDKLINKKSSQLNPFGSIEAITEKVNETLRHETKNFFNTTAKCNIKEWKALREKLKVERARESADGNAAEPPNDPKAIAMKALEDEAYRIEMDYNKNWLLYEKFHLTQAFESQQSRIESDTQTQLKILTDDLDQQKAKYNGPVTAPKQLTPSLDPQTPSRWHHAEKQKTLFNTAPVLMTSPINGSGKGCKDNKPAVRSAQDIKELETLDRDHNAAVAHLHQQKANATNWLLRQRIRLEAQTEEVAVEKAFIADHIMSVIDRK